MYDHYAVVPKNILTLPVFGFGVPADESGADQNHSHCQDTDEADS